MPEEIKSPVGFSVFIDEEMSDALSFMMGTFIEIAMEDPRFAMHPQVIKHAKGMKKLLDQLDDPVHELGWCKDKDCEYKKDERNNRSV